MKKYSVALSTIFAFLFFAITSSFAQTAFAEELRPFDFTDKYYELNGIVASTLVDRKNGADRQSVFDTPSEQNLSNIRITATLPAYSFDGSPIFWNYYGGASRESFTSDEAGGRAIELAYAFPMYVFPSATVKATGRQAALIQATPGYYEKNRIGIAAVFLVEYTDRIFTKTGRLALQTLTFRNGTSLDGTPIIKTAKEIKELESAGLVTVRLADYHSQMSSYAVAKVLRNPERGAITADAFLIYVKESNGKPLAAEAHFLSKFECHQGGGLCF